MKRREAASGGGQLSQLVGTLRVTPRASMRCCGCCKMFLLTRRHSLQEQRKGGGQRKRVQAVGQGQSQEWRQRQ